MCSSLTTFLTSLNYIGFLLSLKNLLLAIYAFPFIKSSFQISNIHTFLQAFAHDTIFPIVIPMYIIHTLKSLKMCYKHSHVNGKQRLYDKEDITCDNCTVLYIHSNPNKQPKLLRELLPIEYLYSAMHRTILLYTEQFRLTY